MLKHVKLIILAVAFLLFGLVSSQIVYAGNPLYMNQDGSPLIWNTAEPIKYRVDIGGLGTLNFDQSLALVQEALAVWENVPGTNIKFEYVGTTDQDITVQNWKTIAGNTIYAEAYGNSSGITQSQINHELIIGFDNTGEIILDKGSNGASGIQSHTGVLGTYENPRYFIAGHVFINGLYYNGTDDDISDLELTDILAILIHEVGHALGLDHNVFYYQLYRDVLYGVVEKDYARYLPSMFPRFIRGSGKYLASLNPDDIATLKWMYGDSDFYSITGDIYDSQGNPQNTLLVTARDSSSSLCHAYAQATSTTCSIMNTNENGSGSTYFNGKFCMDDNALGLYQIPVLHAGGYTIDVSEIDSSFASTIAKFGSVIHEIPGSAEFYDIDDQGSESPYSFDEVVIDGNDLSNMDIVLSSSEVLENRIERIEYDYFEENDFFEILDDDIDCPLDIDENIESNILNAEPVTSVNTSESADLNSSSNGGGCSLNQNHNIYSTSKATLTSFLCMALLALLALKRFKFHQS